MSKTKEKQQLPNAIAETEFARELFFYKQKMRMKRTEF